MKKKLSKILGIGLTVALLVGLIVMAVPAAAQAPVPTVPNSWVVVPGPAGIPTTVIAADCNRIVMGSDGTTIYVVDNQPVASIVWKSTNGGLTWTAVTPAIPAGRTIIAMAVAPDNPNIVGVADSAGPPGTVYLTQDGGATWAAMPPLVGIATANTQIQDMDISPAAPWAVPWGREYMVCTANLNNGVAAGDVIIYGTGANPLGWANQLAPAEDYTSCIFTPGYADYRVILAVGSTLVDTFLHMKKTSLPGWDAAQGFTGWPVAIETAAPGGDSPSEAQILSSAIAVPEDYDPSIPTARRVYASYDSGAAAVNDDAYRVDDISVFRLNVNAGTYR